MKIIIGILLLISVIGLLTCIFSKKGYKDEKERKSSIKFWGIAVVVLMVFMGFVNSCSSKKTETNNNAVQTEDSKKEAKVDYAGITNIKEEKIMNGTGDKEIGKCGVATFDKDKITEESFVKFYNEKIKDSGYNYYTLINKNDKSKGMVFSGCLPAFTYGTIDKSYSVTNGVGDGRIENDKAEYETR